MIAKHECGMACVRFWDKAYSGNEGIAGLRRTSGTKHGRKVSVSQMRYRFTIALTDRLRLKTLTTRTVLRGFANIRNWKALGNQSVYWLTFWGGNGTIKRLMNRFYRYTPDCTYQPGERRHDEYYRTLYARNSTGLRLAYA